MRNRPSSSAGWTPASIRSKVFITALVPYVTVRSCCRLRRSVIGSGTSSFSITEANRGNRVATTSPPSNGRFRLAAMPRRRAAEYAGSVRASNSTPAGSPPFVSCATTAAGAMLLAASKPA